MLNLPVTEAVDSYYDINLEPDSPGSPAEECEYTRLFETAAAAVATASLIITNGQVSVSRASSGDSLSSSDGPYFDPETISEAELKSSLSVDYYDCDDITKCISADGDELQNGEYYPTLIDSDSCSESLPNSQSTTTSLSTFTANNSSASNNTLQDETILELCLLSKEQYQNDDNDEDIVNGDKESIHYTNGDICDFENTISEQIKICEKIVCLGDDIIEGSPKPNILEKYCNSKSEDGPLKLTIRLEEQDDEPHHNVDEKNEKGAEDDDDVRPQRVRRCSSLKTGKTPPGTPGRKKFVRFADVLGLDLADVKTFMDEIPTVPRQAYEDLIISGDMDDDVCDGPMTQQQQRTGPYIDKILVPLFQQPGGMPGFLDLVRERNVCLENAMITDPICLTISGTVRVRNLDFNKSVHLRYSLDSWESYSDFQASYIPKTCDGFSDKFSFTIFGNSLQIGQRIEMAVRFSCKGDQYWDSNFGVNYCFQCLSASSIPILPIQLIGGSDAALTNGSDEPSDATITPVEITAKDLCSGTFY